MDHLKYHTLRNIPLLADVTAEQLSEVVDSFQTESFNKGDHIITQGTVRDEGRAATTYLYFATVKCWLVVIPASELSCLLSPERTRE